jgi:hypothetical protein
MLGLSATRKRCGKKNSLPDFKSYSSICLEGLRRERGVFYLTMPSSAKTLDEGSVSMVHCGNDSDKG